MKKIILTFILLLVSLSLQAENNLDWNPVTHGYRFSEYQLLYSGGDQYTAPAFGDLDGDGDQDLLLGKTGGFPAFYRNDGNADFPEWTLVEKSYSLPAVTSNTATFRFHPALADMDGDEDLDLVMGMDRGFVFYFRNVGSVTAPQWQLVSEDWLGGIVPGENARPAVVDMDNDQDPDLLVGCGEGRICHYVNNPVGNEPQWSLKTEFFQGIDQGSGTPVSPFFADVNGSGYWDLFLGLPDGTIQFYQGAESVYGNRVTLKEERFQDLQLPGTATPAMVDLNRDGTLDFLAGSQSGTIAYLPNIGAPQNPQWGDSQDVWLGQDWGSNACPDLVDVDGDQDKDLCLGMVAGNDGNATLYFVLNDGAPWLTDWRSVEPTSYGITLEIGNINPMPRFADIDADGDMDLALGSTDGTVDFYENQGTTQTAAFARRADLDVECPLASAFLEWNACPALADMDGDGDLDLWVSCLDLISEKGKVYFFRNEGNPQSAAWAVAEDYSAKINPEEAGLLAIAAGETSTTAPDIWVGRSGQIDRFTPTQMLPTFEFTSATLNPGYPYSSLVPAVADINGDGYADLAAGTNAGGLTVFENPAHGAVEIEPHHQTVLGGDSLSFTANPAIAGTWSLIENRSSATLNSASGLYTAGEKAGLDVIGFSDGAGRKGRAYVNVLETGQAGSAGKALLVAGRKANDSLWPSTNELAHKVYNLFLYKGFSRDDILYLNPVTDQDADGNGLQDDIDAATSAANLENALTSWASGASELTIYLIDHGAANIETGRDGLFYLDGGESIEATQFDQWLDTLQESGLSTVTLVADFCQSGSFLLSCSGAPSNKSRAILTSASPYEPAFFSAQGMISFTTSFINALYANQPLLQAFELSAGVMSRYQQAWLDDDGDGLYLPEKEGKRIRGKRLGAGPIAGADRPRIGQAPANISLSGSQTTATLWATDISSPYRIDKVWATLTPPDKVSQSRRNPEDPVLDLPEVELTWSIPRQRYEATTDTFTQSGAWTAHIYARDVWGGVSVPKQVFINQFQLNQDAILFCADSAYDDETSWTVTRDICEEAFHALQGRWLSQQQIVWLSSSTLELAPWIDGPASQTLLHNAIVTYPSRDQRFLFLTGKGSAEGLDLNDNGAYTDSEDLTPALLDEWLDDLQSVSSIRLIVMLDFAGAGAWIHDLQGPPGAERIILTAARDDQTARAWEEGYFSFAHLFFSRLWEGHTLYTLFEQVRFTLFTASGFRQTPQLEDDGSGDADRSDGDLAAETYIGAALVPRSLKPVIGDALDLLELDGSDVTLWAQDISAPQGIEFVYALVQNPDNTGAVENAHRVDLSYTTSTARYEAVVDFLDPNCDYAVHYYCEDRKGLLSDPCETRLFSQSEEDIYDRFFQDDTAAETRSFFSAENFSQDHNFWEGGDEDWAAFHAEANKWYVVTADLQGKKCDATLTLYDAADLSSPMVPEQNWWGPGMRAERISWYSGGTEKDVYIRVKQADSSAAIHGEDTRYTLQVKEDWGANNGLTTLLGSNVMNGANGTLSAPEGGIYSRHSLSIPPGALSEPATILLSGPRDIGPAPFYPSTQQWLNLHPNNASLVWFLTESPLTFSTPATLSIEFLDDGPTVDGFAIDDVLDGYDPEDLRVYQWTGSAWVLAAGDVTIVGNTAQISISSMGVDMGGTAEAIFGVAVQQPEDPPVEPASARGWMLFP